MASHRNLAILATSALLIVEGVLTFSPQVTAQPDKVQDQQQNRSTEKPHPPRPNFAAAAKKLGISEAALIEALGLPPRPPESDRNMPRESCPPPPPPCAKK